VLFRVYIFDGVLTRSLRILVVGFETVGRFARYLRVGPLSRVEVVLFEQFLELCLPKQQGVFLNEFGLLFVLDSNLLVLIEVALLHQGDEG